MTAPAESMPIHIRGAQERDLPAIRDLFLASVLEGQLRSNDEGADIEHLGRTYLAQPTSGFWVACEGDRVVGMIGVLRIGDHTADIRRLRVHEDFRRRGIGRMLTEHAIGFCRRHGYLKIVLDVRAERAPALALFTRSGFTLARTKEVNGYRTFDFYLDLYSDKER